MEPQICFDRPLPDSADHATLPKSMLVRQLLAAFDTACALGQVELGHALLRALEHLVSQSDFPPEERQAWQLQQVEAEFRLLEVKYARRPARAPA